jgi:hypothetical protein
MGVDDPVEIERAWPGAATLPPTPAAATALSGIRLQLLLLNLRV